MNTTTIAYNRSLLRDGFAIPKAFATEALAEDPMRVGEKRRATLRVDGENHVVRMVCIAGQRYQARYSAGNSFAKWVKAQTDGLTKGQPAFLLEAISGDHFAVSLPE